MEALTKPTTNKQEILLHMINHGFVSIFHFPYMSGFRTRISELVREDRLDIETRQKQAVNKFGNTYTFHVHILRDKEQAIQTYNNLTQKN